MEREPAALPLLQHTLPAAAQPAPELSLRTAGSLQQHKPGASCPEGASASGLTAARGAGSGHSPSSSHPAHSRLEGHAENNQSTNPRTPRCRRRGDIAIRATYWCSPAPREGMGLGQELLGEVGRSDLAALAVPPGLCAYESLRTGKEAGRSRSPCAYRRGGEWRQLWHGEGAGSDGVSDSTLLRRVHWPAGQGGIKRKRKKGRICTALSSTGISEGADRRCRYTRG